MNGSGRDKGLGASFDIKRPNECNLIISPFIPIYTISPSFLDSGRPPLGSEVQVKFYKVKGRVGFISLMGEESPHHVRQGQNVMNDLAETAKMPQFVQYTQAIGEGKD